MTRDVAYDPIPSARITGGLTVALAILGPLALAVMSFQAFWYFIAGAVAWCVAVGVKVGGMRIVGRVFDGLRLAPVWRAAIQGTWSATTELSLASIVFALAPRPMLLLNVLAVGLGAASTEILYLVALGTLRSTPAQTSRLKVWIVGAQMSWVVRHVFFVERAIASIGHIAARALIYIAVYRYSIWPGLVALACFAFVDGEASYGHLRKWDWLRPDVAHKYYATAMAIVCIEVIAIIICTRRGSTLSMEDATATISLLFQPCLAMTLPRW